MARIITLITDFGISDGYVASMKGVILSINPSAVIVDISHAVEPQYIRQAAFILHTSWRYFPESTIHVAVVDPEVGSSRKIVALKTPRAYFIAPDNGILSYILYELAGGYKTHSYPASNATSKRPIPDGCEAITLTKEEYWRHPVSATFHGRDIFAPVAAHLSMDIPLSELGEPVTQLHVFPVPEPFKDAMGRTVGHIIHIDRFGNLITNLRSKDIPREGAAVEIHNQRIDNTAPYYSKSTGLMAIIGGNDYLELSVRNGSAADLLGARVGDTVTVHSRPHS